MSEVKINMNNLKDQLDKLEMDIPSKLACIYDLWQNYEIEEKEEEELYDYVDPNEEYNNVSEYWWNMDYENPLKVEVMDTWN